jgi:hypothetical protein
MYFVRVTDNFRQCIHKSLANEQMNPMVGEDRLSQFALVQKGMFKEVTTL